ncbi:unnamed protein product [Rotaria socialis]|uniref:Uncharacterized protein n=1 Tax=Rotaria socialis TaxID=392032 RepID=A0A820YPM5_9BILA|nr:unnamed protein product [Rotaria socialis]CAF4550848.1 unnamed protein product [Rotaria socialis]
MSAGKQSNFFSTNRGAELQRHNRSDGELKQQHEVLLSTLLLEQQLHSTSTDEHKRPPRSPPSTVDFYFSDITANTTPIVDGDSAKQNEIIVQQILFTQCHRDLEQDSNKGIEVLESAEYEWKSETKRGQQQRDDLFSSPINLILSLFSCLDKIRYW